MYVCVCNMYMYVHVFVHVCVCARWAHGTERTTCVSICHDDIPHPRLAMQLLLGIRLEFEPIPTFGSTDGAAKLSTLERNGQSGSQSVGPNNCHPMALDAPNLAEFCI